jgi:hypothetical protein
MAQQMSSDTGLAVELPELDLGWSRATGAPPSSVHGPTRWSWLSRATRSIDLHKHERDHGIRNAWIAVAAAFGVGALDGVKLWYLHGSEPQSRLLSSALVHGLVALVLTPLIVGVHLALPDLARRMLWRLRDDEVVEVRSEATLDEAAPWLGWFNHRRLVLASAALAAVYFGFLLVTERDALEFPMGILVVVPLLVQAALLYLAVVMTGNLFILSHAVGQLLQNLQLHIQLLHPDRSGGLWIVGRLFSLMLNVAAVFAGVALCMTFALDALHQANYVPSRRPELYLLGLFYLVLLPSAFLNLLWLPHKKMEHRRSQVLKPVARAFDAAVDAARPSRTDGAERLKAKADSLSEIARQLTLLDETSPAWPLRMKRLGPVVVTAILPVAVGMVTTVLSKLLTG